VKSARQYLYKGVAMSDQEPPKQHRWRGPIISFVLGIPIAGAIIVTAVTILFLDNAGDLNLTWASAGAIGLSILVSFALLFIVFMLGIVFTLRVFFGILGTLLDDIFPTEPKPRRTTPAHPADEFLLNMTHSFIMPHLPKSGQPAAPAAQETVVDAVPQYAQGQETSTGSAENA
jgi:hypothetical protein